MGMEGWEGCAIRMVASGPALYAGTIVVPGAIPVGRGGNFGINDSYT